jgi:hypothetical protein
LLLPFLAARLATPSSKPLPLRLLGLALLVLQRLSIWLSLVVVGVEAELMSAAKEVVVAAGLVDLEQVLGFL